MHMVAWPMDIVRLACTYALGMGAVQIDPQYQYENEDEDSFELYSSSDLYVIYKSIKFGPLIIRGQRLQ